MYVTKGDSHDSDSDESFMYTPLGNCMKIGTKLKYMDVCIFTVN